MSGLQIRFSVEAPEPEPFVLTLAFWSKKQAKLASGVSYLITGLGPVPQRNRYDIHTYACFPLVTSKSRPAKQHHCWGSVFGRGPAEHLGG